MKKSFQRVIATLNLFQGKQSLTIFLLAAIFALTACDDSSSASSDETGVSSSSVESPDSSVTLSGASAESNGSSDETKDKSSSSENKSSSSTKEPKVSSDSKSSSSIKSGDSSSSKKDTSSSSENSSSSKNQSSSSSVKQSSSSLAKSSSSGEYVPYAHTADLGPLWFDDVFKQFVDTRNNRSYYYLTIYNKDHSDSLTVFAENLNIGEMVEFIDSTSFQSDNKKIERFCYDNDTTNCDRYGGLYQWAEMMGFNDSCNTKSCAHLIQEDHQGICPKGWRLMTYDDYKFVAQSENVIHNSYEDMRTQNGFNGYNATGFSLVPAGYIWSNGFKNLREATYFHYPAESVKFDANKFSRGGYAGMSGGGLNEQNTKKRYGLSVRCAMVTNKIGNN